MDNTRCLTYPKLVITFGSTALLGALTGCTTYFEQPPREVHVTPPPPVYVTPASVEIRSESEFYEPLSPYGRGEVVGAYGRCWIPRRVASDWRPYSHGYWQ